MELQKLPNATAVLILGIFSLLGCCCYGIIGLVCGIIALVLFQKDNLLYNQNPTMYSNYSQLNIGRVLAIIGIVVSILYLVFMVFYIAYFGLEAMSDPDLMKEKMNELMRDMN